MQMYSTHSVFSHINEYHNNKGQTFQSLTLNVMQDSIPSTRKRAFNVKISLSHVPEENVYYND
jgi:hypothetical protein